MSFFPRIVGAVVLTWVTFCSLTANGINGSSAPIKADATSIDTLSHTLSKRAVCSLLLNSELQNAYYEQEAEKADAGKGTLLTLTASLAKGGASSATDSLFAMPASLFPTLVLPEPFVALALPNRIISYDTWRQDVTAEEAARYNPKSTGQMIGSMAKKTATTAARGISTATKAIKKTAKNAAGAAFDAATGAIGISDEVKAVTETTSSVVSSTKNTFNSLTGKRAQTTSTADVVSNSTLLYEDEVDEYANAVIHNYLTQTHVAAQLVARWYDYEPDSLQRWNPTAALIDKADSVLLADSSLLGDTYVVVTNLRLRSMQAIQQEVATAAKSAGSTFGVVGKLAVKAASTASSAVIGDGYAVQAISYLYKLRWDEERDSQFRTAILDTNATLDDLIGLDLCSLDYVGREKATVNIRQSIVSTETVDGAVKEAIERAVDESIAKLF